MLLFINITPSYCKSVSLAGRPKTAAHDAEKYAASCAGQLNLYRQAVEAATGKKVLQTIIHLPNLGRCYEVKIAK